MTLYKDQLSTTMTLPQFIDEMNFDLAYYALEALLAYDGIENKIDYDNYLIFHIETLKSGIDVWGITKIIDEWQPIEVSDRIRKFTKNKVWKSDSYATINII